MKSSLKLLSLSICMIIMTVFFAGCNKSTAEEINFFNYGENIDKETVEEFEKEYGIKLISKLLMIWKPCIKSLAKAEQNMTLF